MKRSGPPPPPASPPPPPEDEDDGRRPGASWLRVTGVLGARAGSWNWEFIWRGKDGWGVDGVNGSGSRATLIVEMGSGEDSMPVVVFEGSAMTGVDGWISAGLMDGFAGLFDCLASLWAFVVKLSLTFFMPVVRLSISVDFELDGCFVGSVVLLVLEGTSTVPSIPNVARPFSARGDLRRTGVGLEPSARG